MRLIVPVILLALAVCGCGSEDNSPTGPSTITIEEISVGTGAVAQAGDTVTVHYVGRLTNGTQFDTSYDGNPITFRLGANQVIAGFDQGIVGMRVGGKRRVTIPPSLGYGNVRTGPIPPNSTLVFDLELMAVSGR